MGGRIGCTSNLCTPLATQQALPALLVAVMESEHANTTPLLRAAIGAPVTCRRDSVIVDTVFAFERQVEIARAFMAMTAEVDDHGSMQNT